MRPRRLNERRARFHRSALAALAAVAALVAGACSRDGGGAGEGGSGATTDAPAPAVVVGADQRSITVRTGQRFAIELSENPSIGNKWIVTRQPDPGVARLTDSSYRADPGSEKRVGAGGTRVLVFDALAPGATAIEVFDCFRCGTNTSVSKDNERHTRRITYHVTVE